MSYDKYNDFVNGKCFVFGAQDYRHFRAGGGQGFDLSKLYPSGDHYEISPRVTRWEREDEIVE